MKSGVCLVELQQLALEGRELEEVVFFAHRLRDAAAVRARSSRRHIDPGLVGDAVLARVRALVDEAAIAQGGEELLHAALVARLGGADEVVVGEAEASHSARNSPAMAVAKLLRRAAGQLGGALDLLPVFVGAGEEPGIDAERPLAPRDGVAHDGRVGVAQVRPRIHVVDGRGEVEAG